MDDKTTEKAKSLIEQTRVMTLAVSGEDKPWPAPVYFVYCDDRFFFFSNENSRHIRYSASGETAGASVFHDSNKMDKIFGLQMSGKIEAIPLGGLYFNVVKKYVGKFDFLKKTFGTQIFDNPNFFLEKFKSGLYSFFPETVYLSDNSNTTGKRRAIDLKDLFVS